MATNTTTTTKAFDLATDIPDLSGKTILLTGGTAGLGQATLLALAAHNPSHIFFTGRSAARANDLISTYTASFPSTKLTFIPCDLSSFSSIQSAARTFLSSSANTLDLLFCNAGIMAVPPGLTSDGYELQFGTNHMGHALLIKLLLPTLLLTAEQRPPGAVRIVLTTSEGFAGALGLPFDKLKTPMPSWLAGPWVRYGQSKLANILYARELAARYPRVKSVAVHPGVINTGLVSGLSWGSNLFVHLTTWWRQVGVEEGIKNGVWAATAREEEVVNGGFYLPVGVTGWTTSASRDDGLARELWEWTEKELETWEV